MEAKYLVWKPETGTALCSALLVLSNLIRWHCMLRLEILKNAYKYWNILTNTEKIFALHLVLVNILRKKTSITDSVTGNLKSRDASASKKILENICFALLLCHRNLIRWHCMLRLETPKNTNKYWKILKKKTLKNICSASLLCHQQPYKVTLCVKIGPVHNNILILLLYFHLIIYNFYKRWHCVSRIIPCKSISNFSLQVVHNSLQMSLTINNEMPPLKLI